MTGKGALVPATLGRHAPIKPPKTKDKEAIKSQNHLVKEYIEFLRHYTYHMGKSPPIGVGLPKTKDLPCFLTLLVHSLSVPPAGGGVSPCLRSGHHAPNARLSARTATRKAMLRMARLPPQGISHLPAECLPCFSCGQMTFNERRLCGRNLLMLDIS